MLRILHALMFCIPLTAQTKQGDLCMSSPAVRPFLRTRLSAAVIAALSQSVFASITWAQTAEQSQSTSTAPAAEKVETVVVTGTRIPAASVTSTSPVSQFSAQDIAINRAVTVEDFSVKLPQLAGGVSSTSVGSDAFGAQTLDLRNLGQSRTLVLINGTRAVPFSFRNAVDVNFIPAPLLKRVDVLTGGAAAVYGADAISGVVNFIINDGFRGLQANANYRTASGGATQSGVNFTGGWGLGDRGSVVAYLEYTQRDALLAGERDWAIKNPLRIAGNGGNFTDVASGRTFSFDAAGQFTTTPQTTDYTPQFILVQPLKRINLSAFAKYDITDSLQAYGRVMFSNIKTTGASRTGQAPVVINEVYGIRSDNPFLPPEARSQLTFVNDVAQVRVNRSLGELGLVRANNDRDTSQVQIGLRGPLTAALDWDVYAQTGRSSETVLVTGDGVKAQLASTINSIDIFGPGADLSGVAQTFKYGDRIRTQSVYAANITGDSSDLFKLPAGPLGVAFGVEARREKGTFDYNPALGQSFAQGVESGPPVPPFFNANEIYAEIMVPVVKDLPGVKALNFEAAYRNSDYKKSVGGNNSYDTDKLGLSWAVNDDLRLRSTRQSVIREPNFGEFANPVFSIPFSRLVTVARLQPRYRGDPCALGTGNAEQCARFGAAPVGSYNSLDPALLTGGYFFGGNPDIRAERGTTRTFGFVLTPTFAPGLSTTVDYYHIKIRDAVGVVQPVDALTSCYITDPRADNPLCQAVTRDPATGRIKDGFPVDRNLALIEQKGFDLDVSYKHKLPAAVGGNLTWQYQAAFVRDYTIQRNPVLQPLDCKGTYGSTCSSDAVSLVAPDYRHRASITWALDALTTQLGWKRIGKVRDSALGSTESIAAQNYFDLNFSWQPAAKGVRVNVGIDNVANKQPPTPKNASLFNTYPDTYNAVGRSYGVSVTYLQ
jgi:iron complex outermembrane recepter protein